MAFSDTEKTDIRRYCGYPAHGVGGLLEGWRYYQVYGLLEYRLLWLSGAEEAVVRQYLATLAVLETAVADAGKNLDTDQAAMWTRNPNEVRERVALFDEWRRRLVGFMGVPPGPALARNGLVLVV